MGTSFLRRVAAPKMHRIALELVELLKTKSAIADGRPFYFLGDFDLVAVGRALLQDPNWVVKIQADRRDELMSYEASALKTLA